MNKIRLRNLFEKYLNSTCSESELEELLDFLKRADFEPEIKAVLSEYWNELSETDLSEQIQYETDEEKWFHEIYSQALAREDSSAEINNSARTVSRRVYSRKMTETSWMKAAAVMLAAVLLSLVYFNISQDAGSGEEMTYGIKAPEAGEKIRFTLSDGTQVHLNSESTLKYPKNFDENSREVQLVGEAYFVVVRDEARPFLVHTEEITTRVLGTSFNVRSYPAEEEIVVAVSSGKVALIDQQASGDNPEVLLEANQWANYSHKTQNFNSGSGDISAFTAWNEGVLLYHDETLDYVASQLERWYGVSISFENEVLKNCVIRGEHRDESLVNVLNAISYAFNMNYEIADRHVTLMGDSCS